MRNFIAYLALISEISVPPIGIGSGQAPGVTQQTRSQTAGTNTGTMIQNNITVNPTVKQVLKGRAKKDLQNEHGWLKVLTPANDPTPKDDCDPVLGTLKVLLGGGFVAGCAGGSSCTIIKDGTPNAPKPSLLSIRLRGTILELQAVVFDEDGRVVAALEGNKPHVNQNNVFEWSRPDEHTLDVIDQKDRKALHIRFLNPRTVYVEGIFFNSAGVSAVFSSSGATLRPKGRSLQLSGVTMSRNCAAGSGAVFVF